ncbi:hypothetical protein MKW98_016151 [Papaver atlanticum]|uniref:Cytochrome P450 n=1 Tax=Papaver atlanticum TaxID=357466 RepID=A0AAD4X803_9MAGN|nr:hypothetical protein MKW98_016151 [Papaver atlanticum]
MQVDLPNIEQKYYPLITGLLLALLSFYYLWVSIARPSRNSRSKLRPPEVAGSWPIVGHLPQLVGSTPLFKTLANMSEKYGPIFMVRFGMHPTLVVSSWEMSKECFTTNDKFLASRPPSASAKYLAYDHAMFGFSFYGPYWRETRKISTLQLLTHKRLESLKHIPYSEINSCVKTLYTRWAKTQSQIKQNVPGAAEDFVKVDMTEMFGHLTLNVVLRFVVGKPVFIQKDNYEDDTNDCHKEEELEGLKLHKTIVEFFELSGASVASDVLPYLGWLDVDGQKKRMKKISKEMDSIAEKWLEEHRQKRRLQPLSDPASIEINHDDENDFMAVLLSVLDEGKDDLFFGYNRDIVIKATCLTLILAGRRMCPGINFAAQTLHMTLARLLHAFDFDYESNGLVIDMTEGSGLTMPKVTPLEVHLRPRLLITLY